MRLYSFILWATATLAALGLVIIFTDYTGILFVLLIGTAVALSNIPKRNYRAKE
jgi:hypothetical protein